jgi:hypothetical protein
MKNVLSPISVAIIIAKEFIKAEANPAPAEKNELKKDVKEILRLMNALYDFEASQS